MLIVWGVHLQACPFVRPCHFDKIDNYTTKYKIRQKLRLKFRHERAYMSMMKI